MHISHIKTNLTILIELLSVYIMNKKIDNWKSNVKGTWKVLNEILNRNRGKGGFQSTFKADSQEISDPKEIAYYSRQSLSRSLNKRRRNGTVLEWVGSGKDREGREGKEKHGRIRCDTWKGETNNLRLAAAKRYLRELGRNEMRSSYLYTRCKGLARIETNCKVGG